MLGTDLRFAVRRLIQSPAFSVASVLMLALGIAISATMFGVLQGVLGSLPYPQSDQLVAVESSSPLDGQSQAALTPVEAQRLAEGPSPFADFGYYVWGGTTLLSESRPRELRMVSVSPDFFSTLGSAPLLGRWFNADDYVEGAAAAILSHAEWQRLFAGAEDVIGRRFEIASGTLEVVGVMPADFAAPAKRVQLWRPLPSAAYPLDQPWTRTARFLYAYARLDPAIPAAQRDAQLQAISGELAESQGLPTQRWQFSTRDLLTVLVGDLRGVLWGAFAVALLVLVIACANLAILIDARQVARRQQLAVQQALGASRQRVYLGLLLEIIVIALAALMLGALLASFSVEALRELASGSLPRTDAIRIDGAVWLFAGAIALSAPLFAALAGSLRLRSQPIEAIRGGGRGVLGASGGRRWLPALGVALSAVSLSAGGALSYSLYALQQVDPGFDHQPIYALQLFHGEQPAQQRSFAEALGERLAAIPGAESVAWTNAAPLSVIGSSSVELRMPDRPDTQPLQLGLRRISPEYQAALQIPLLEGRSIASTDRAGGEPVVVINQALAQQLFGAESALERIIELPLSTESSTPHRVIGVSADTSNRGLQLAPGPEAWIPFDAQPSMAMTFLLRSAQPIEGIDAQLQDALYAVDPGEAATRIFRLSDDLDAELAPARFFASVVGAFALAALMLAAFGVYAVAALRQQQRIAEYGLRLAIGARPLALATAALIDSLRSLAGGLLLGLIGAWLTLRLLQAQIYQADQAQSWALGGALLVLLASLSVAALIPALRASRVDPMVALRSH
ncbi:MAG: ABC transporter permease [Xanthomonadales bacterium]|nr:ABC transporter permease [Xanthomonadales bacterium]